MYDKQVKKTAKQSQHMIADALFCLMERKPLQRITITEICEEAAIGRKTFYRNFDLKEDVIDFQLDLLCEEYRQNIQNIAKEDFLYNHFAFVHTHSKHFLTLYQNGLYELTYQKFAILLPATMPIWSDDPIEQEYRSQYIISGIEGIQRVWIKRKFQESIEQVVSMTVHAQENQPPLRWG